MHLCVYGEGVYILYQRSSCLPTSIHS